MSASRSKFPSWTVSHTERRLPRRSCAREKLGADGMREYSIFKCVNNCNNPFIAILTDNIHQNKNQAIEDHLSMCQAIPEDERPKKIHRGGISATALADPAKRAELLPNLHAECLARHNKLEEKIDSLQIDVSNLKELVKQLREVHKD